MKGLLIISLDAVGERELDRLCLRPHFGALMSEGSLTRGVESVFPTNTYPVHASVVTGLVPGRHGLISNTEAFPSRHPRWLYKESGIKATTLWQAAAEKGLKTAAVLWPVTGGSKSIRYNIPELMKQPGESQIFLNMRYGSKLLQLKELLRHRKLLDGINQPRLDYFSAACMADILREKKPDLALVHLTAYDMLCHTHGLDSPQLETALDSLDENLGRLLMAAGDMAVMVFTDHGQLAVSKYILPNRILIDLEMAVPDYNDPDLPLNNGLNCFFECAGGCAFFHPGNCGIDSGGLERLKRRIGEEPGFSRFLTEIEMDGSGHGNLPFGFCVGPGYCCSAHEATELANHGYPVDTQDFSVFYLLRDGTRKPSVQYGGSLLDIAPLAADILGISDLMGYNNIKEPVG